MDRATESPSSYVTGCRERLASFSLTAGSSLRSHLRALQSQFHCSSPLPTYEDHLDSTAMFRDLLNPLRAPSVSQNRFDAGVLTPTFDSAFSRETGESTLSGSVSRKTQCTQMNSPKSISRRHACRRTTVTAGDQILLDLSDISRCV